MWVNQELQDICTYITDGKHGDCKDQSDSGYYFISSKDVYDSKIRYQGARQITKADFDDTHRRTRLEPCDTLITNSGSIGRMAFVTDSEETRKTTFQKSVAILKPDKNKILPRYLYYAVLSESEKIIDTAVGTAQKNLLLRDLRRIQIHLPKEKRYQRKIAAILSAYDDLIEVNERRIALLEKMAEELYREWFVRMRFPGHESIDPKTGLPKNWKRSTFFKELEVLSGGTPKTDILAFWDGPIPFFTPKDAEDRVFVQETEKRITEQGLKACNSRLFPPNTIFITARGTVGKIVMNSIPMAMNQSCYALTPKSSSNTYYYFFALNKAVSIIKSSANSGVFDNIVVDSFKKYDLIVPAQKTMDAFCNAISPLLSYCLVLQKSNHILQSTRDRLLSRLMSGALDVEELDIAFPPSMEEELAAQA